MVKNPPAKQERPWLGKMPWRRKWQPIPVGCPGKSHAQRSLAGFSQWAHKDLDTTERLKQQEQQQHVHMILKN